MTKKNTLHQKRNHSSVKVRPASTLSAGGSQSIRKAWPAVIAATMIAMTARGMIGTFLYTEGTLVAAPGRANHQSARVDPSWGVRVSLMRHQGEPEGPMRRPDGAQRGWRRSPRTR